jgi:3-oxoacyl-[acyl-carrier protein] reductase
VVGYRTSQAAAERVASDIQASDGSAAAVQVDVTDDESVERLIADAVQRYGRLDIVVNVAGRIDSADAVRFMDSRLAETWKLFDVDVFGTFRVCQAAVPQMLANDGGVIVNVGSTHGTGAFPENPVTSVPVCFCAAKAALRGFTVALARDLAPRIRVNAVAPGPIMGNWEADWGISKRDVEVALDQTPLKRMGSPEEVAETILFLASDGGGYVTGQVIQVDGGWVMA